MVLSKSQSEYTKQNLQHFGTYIQKCLQVFWKMKAKQTPKSIFCCWDSSHSYTLIALTYVQEQQKWTFHLLGSYSQLEGGIVNAYKNLLLLVLQDAIVILYNHRIQIKPMGIFCSFLLGSFGFVFLFVLFVGLLFGFFGFFWFGLGWGFLQLRSRNALTNSLEYRYMQTAYFPVRITDFSSYQKE